MNLANTQAPAGLPAGIPAFDDNYLWLLSHQGLALVVDPGDAVAVNRYLEQNQLELVAILLTHHHPDHIGGVDALRQRWPQVAVYGPADERMPEDIQVVADGAQVELPQLDVTFQVIATPGHTLSHLVYYGNHQGQHLLFCGDTLFSVGCGRLFEGTPEQMQASLDRLTSLPDETWAFPAHEYTQSNCRFALAVEPANQDLQAYSEAVASARAADRPTLPTTLALERRCNPFMRTREPEVIAAAQAREPGCGDTPAQVMGVIRRWKDQF